MKDRMICVIPSAGRAGRVETHKLFRKPFLCVPESRPLNTGSTMSASSHTRTLYTAWERSASGSSRTSTSR
jgi:hypothetical protein